MCVEDSVLVMRTIGNHDEGTCDTVSPVSSARILADKSYVPCSRVRSVKETKFDIHCRVNYAVTKSELQLDAQKKVVTLILDIDRDISDLVESLEILPPLW